MNSSLVSGSWFLADRSGIQCGLLLLQPNCHSIVHSVPRCFVAQHSCMGWFLTAQLSRQFKAIWPFSSDLTDQQQWTFIYLFCMWFDLDFKIHLCLQILDRIQKHKCGQIGLSKLYKAEAPWREQLKQNAEISDTLLSLGRKPDDFVTEQIPAL